eukprot:g12007.t1
MSSNNNGGPLSRARATTYPPMTTDRNVNGDGGAVFPPAPIQEDIELGLLPVHSGDHHGQHTGDDTVDVALGREGAAQDGVGDGGAADVRRSSPVPAGGGPQGSGITVGNAQRMVSNNGPISGAMSVMRRLGGALCGPIVAQGVTTAVAGGGPEYNRTHPMVPFTRSDNSYHSDNGDIESNSSGDASVGGGGVSPVQGLADATAGERTCTRRTLTVTRSDNSDIESNLPGDASGGGGDGGGGGGGGGGGVAAAQALAERGGLIAAQGGLQDTGGGGGGDDILGDVLDDDRGRDIPDRAPDDGRPRPSKEDVLAVSVLLLEVTVPIFWLAGYARTPEAVIIVVLATLSLATDCSHRRGIEMNCLGDIPGRAVVVGLYTYTWTCFTLFGIGALVK